MPSTPTRSERLSVDDDWDDCEYATTGQPPLTETTSKPDNGTSPNAESISETVPVLRHGQRNTQKPIRYTDTWACK